MKSKTTKFPPIKSRAEMEEALGCMYSMSNALQQALGEQAAEMQRIRDGFAEEIHTRASMISAIEKAAEKWAKDNRQEFGDKKSIEMTHATIGYRNCPPSVETLSKWNAEKILAAIKEIPKFQARYVRSCPELNKQAILEDRAIIQDEELRSIGLKISKDEVFYIDLKEENTTEVAS